MPKITETQVRGELRDWMNDAVSDDVRVTYEDDDHVYRGGIVSASWIADKLLNAIKDGRLPGIRFDLETRQ